MAYKFRNLTDSTLRILGPRDERGRRPEHQIHPERSWGAAPFPPKVLYEDKLDIHHPAEGGIIVDVVTRRAAQVSNLPDPEPFTFFVVDRDVAEAARRSDIVYVHQTIDDRGVPFVTSFATAILQAGGTPVRCP